MRVGASSVPFQAVFAKHLYRRLASRRHLKRKRQIFAANQGQKDALGGSYDASAVFAIYRAAFIRRDRAG